MADLQADQWLTLVQLGRRLARWVGAAQQGLPTAGLSVDVADGFFAAVASWRHWVRLT